MKNLLYLAEAIKGVKSSDPKHELGLLWLTRRLTKQVNFEVSHAPQKYTVVSKHTR